MTIKEYEAIEATRVSEIVKFATKDLNTIVSEHLNPKTNDSMLLGTAIHSMVLRNDRTAIPEDIALIDASDFRGKEAQRLKSEALENGKIPLLKSKYESLCESVYKVKNAFNYFFPSNNQYEVPFFGEDSFFGKVKGRIDCLETDANNNIIKIIDLKVTSDLSNISKKIFDMGYQLQMFLYMNLAECDSAQIVFFNPETSLFSYKNLKLNQIAQECEALLKRAEHVKARFDKYLSGCYLADDNVEYETPQWAFSKLIDFDYK